MLGLFVMIDWSGERFGVYIAFADILQRFNVHIYHESWFIKLMFWDVLFMLAALAR